MANTDRKISKRGTVETRVENYNGEAVFVEKRTSAKSWGDYARYKGELRTFNVPSALIVEDEFPERILVDNGKIIAV